MVFIHSIYIILFVAINPFEEYRKYRIELINEVLLMFVFYHLFCFTEFMPDIDAAYMMGESFLFFLAILILMNIQNVI